MTEIKVLKSVEYKGKTYKVEYTSVSDMKANAISFGLYGPRSVCSCQYCETKRVDFTKYKHAYVARSSTTQLSIVVVHRIVPGRGKHWATRSKLKIKRLFIK